MNALEKAKKRENIAHSLGFKSWDYLVTFTRCCGVTLSVLEAWEESGKLEEYVKML